MIEGTFSSWLGFEWLGNAKGGFGKKYGRVESCRMALPKKKGEGRNIVQQARGDG